jgi:uncharacterized membrane protein
MLKIKGSFQKVFASPKMAILISKLDKFFIKLPHLPKKIRLLISKIVPYLALIFGIIALIAAVVSGALLVLSFFAWDTMTVLEIGGSFLLILLDTLFLLKAFKPLRAGNAVGWIYLFWAMIMEIVNLVISVINGEADLRIGIPSLILGFYLLFEIGQFYVYKNE